ncbi:uncharacterized protein LOC131948003 [Physella acuta]|uniref:uncharacterized protein LOC131948003 n=1 Tax=Physella acuta TaxID=109671 RepID=UPI0027DBA3BB|nr:uncharacterized protein LOC131948003 [Physella acuta]
MASLTSWRRTSWDLLYPGLIISMTLLAGIIQPSRASIQVKKCFSGSMSDTAGDVTLQCPEGQAITIEEAYLGRNKWGACVITDEDCFEKTKMFQHCEGLTNCSKTFKTYSLQCGYSTIFLLSYYCSAPTSAPATSTWVSTTALANQTTQMLAVDVPSTQADPLNLVLSSPTTISQTTLQPWTDHSQGDSKELGIIVGCVVSITSAVLITAIILVLRKLLQKQKEEPQSASSSDNSSTCQTQKILSSQQNNASENRSSLRLSKKRRKSRLTPVGEEDMSGQSTQTQVRSHVSRRSLTKLTSPLNSGQTNGNLNMAEVTTSTCFRVEIEDNDNNNSEWVTKENLQNNVDPVTSLEATSAQLPMSESQANDQIPPTTEITSHNSSLANIHRNNEGVHLKGTLC